MKILLSVDIRDTLFKGKDKLPKQRESIYNEMIDIVQSIVPTTWTLDRDKFNDHVKEVHPDEHGGYYAFINALYTYLHPVYVAYSRYGVMVENIIFNHYTNIVTVIATSKRNMQLLASERFKYLALGDVPDEASTA